MDCATAELIVEIPKKKNQMNKLSRTCHINYLYSEA